MNLQEELLNKLDEATAENHFPVWGDEDDLDVLGKMRVLGFSSPLGVALVFESAEYSSAENCITSNVRCFATFPINTWLCPGNGIYVPYEALHDPDTGEFNINSETLKVSNRGKDFVIDLAHDKLIDESYLSDESDSLSERTVLFKICDTIPSEYLFSEPEYIKTKFGIDQNAQCIISLEQWGHPTFELYAEDENPSSYNDIRAIAEALCTGNPEPELSGTSNTSWQDLYQEG